MARHERTRERLAFVLLNVVAVAAMAGIERKDGEDIAEQVEATPANCRSS